MLTDLLVIKKFRILVSVMRTKCVAVTLPCSAASGTFLTALLRRVGMITPLKKPGRIAVKVIANCAILLLEQLPRIALPAI